MTLKQDDITIKNPAQVLSIKIYGEPASKANSRRVVRFGGMSRLIKSKKALSYSELFKQQCEPLGLQQFTGDVCVSMHIYYASRRPDLDESLILDLLQGVAYKNDRQVKEKHIYWHLDKDSPRAEITISLMPVQEDKKRPARGGPSKERQLT